MPNCIQLTKKGESKPTPFILINEELCTHFAKPCHKTVWYHGWYDYIAFSLAMGKDWTWLHEQCRNPYQDKTLDDETRAYWTHMDEIVSFLEERYTTAAWYEHKGAPSVLADEAHANSLSAD